MSKDRVLILILSSALVAVLALALLLWRAQRTTAPTLIDQQSPQAWQEIITPAVPHREIQTGKFDLHVVAEGLNTPCAVAVQPGTRHVLVSTSEGIVRIVPGDPATQHDEITGFPTDTYGRGPVYTFGPLGLAFVDEHLLAVGGGGMADGEDVVRFYWVGDEPLPDGKVRQADDAKYVRGPITADAETSIRGEGNYFGIALHDSTLLVTSNGDDTKGWINRIDLSGDGPGPLEPFVASKVLTDIDAPTGIAITPQGKLLVSQFGETHQSAHSVLGIYDLTSGQLEQRIQSTLRNIVAIAFSPSTGQLYAIDFAWAAPEEAGLFDLNIQGGRATSRRIADLAQPTAMAFDGNGTLYIAVLGRSRDGQGASGKLLSITGL